MFIVIVHRLFQNLEKSALDGREYIYSDWESYSNIAPFPSKEDAIAYLKDLKKEYRGKGKTKDGRIIGRKTTVYGDTKTVEEIVTDLIETDYGKEVEVANEYDVGECPFGNT